jgi:hypothetical protein
MNRNVYDFCSATMERKEAIPEQRVKGGRVR